MRLKATTSIAAFAAFFAGSALAADIHRAEASDVYQGYQESQQAMTNWSGFYVGGQLGYGVDVGDLSIDAVPQTARSGSAFVDSLAGQGVVGGLSAGVDVTQGRWLFGVRGEYNLHDQDFDAGIASPRTGVNLNVSADQSWAAVGRVGYIAARDTLVYGLIGYTQKDFDLDASLNGTSFYSDEKTLDGIVTGVGIDIAKADKWFFGVEGTYTMYEDADWFEGSGVRVSADQNEFRAMARIRKQLGSF